MSTISRRPPGLSTRAASASAAAGAGRWCSTSISVAASSEPSSIGSASSEPRRSSTFARPRVRVARGGEHLVRRVDADHARDVRRERGDDRAGAAAEIADDPVRRQQTRGAPAARTSRPNRSSRSRSHCPADVAKNCCDVSLRRASTRCEPARVLIERRTRRRAARASAPRSARAIVRSPRAPARSSGSCRRAATSPSRRRPASSDAGSPSTAAAAARAQSSDTVSSWRSSSHSIRQRVASARAENESSRDGAAVGINP